MAYLQALFYFTVPLYFKLNILRGVSAIDILLNYRTENTLTPFKLCFFLRIKLGCLPCLFYMN